MSDYLIEGLVERIARALERIADSLEKSTKDEEDKNGPAIRGFGIRRDE